MKKIITILLCVMLVLSFTGCGNSEPIENPVDGPDSEPPVIGINYYTLYDTDDEWCDEGFVVATAKYDSLYLINEDYFPELAIELERINEGIKDVCVDGMLEAADLAISNQEYLQDYWYGPYCDESSITVKRADSNVFSFEVYDYCDHGGAHPSYYCISYNIDAVTGQRIQYEDVVLDEIALRNAIEESFIEQGYDDDCFYTGLSEELDKFAGPNKESDFTFTISPYGIDVYFNPYVIAPYVGGMFGCFIPFEGNDFLNDRYAEIPQNLIMPIYPYAIYDMDFDGDGKLDHKFSFEYGVTYPDANNDDYSTVIYEEATVTIDNDSVLTYSLTGVDIPMEEVTAYFMHTVNNECFLIVQGGYGSELDNLVVNQIYANGLISKGISVIRDDYPGGARYTSAQDFIEVANLENEIFITK